MHALHVPIDLHSLICLATYNIMMHSIDQQLSSVSVRSVPARDILLIVVWGELELCRCTVWYHATLYMWARQRSLLMGVACSHL